METPNFSPQQSLQLITQVIEDARQRFTENGFSFLLWGSLTVIASLGQYYLIHIEQYSVSFYPYFIMFVGGIIEFVKRRNTVRKNSNQIAKFISLLWLFLSINILTLAFGFFWSLQQNLVPLILILVSIGINTTGSIIRERVVWIGGIFLNIVGILCFFIDWEYHALVNAAASFIGIVIPGLYLRFRSKE